MQSAFKEVIYMFHFPSLYFPVDSLKYSLSSELSKAQFDKQIPYHWNSFHKAFVGPIDPLSALVPQFFPPFLLTTNRAQENSTRMGKETFAGLLGLKMQIIINNKLLLLNWIYTNPVSCELTLT